MDLWSWILITMAILTIIAVWFTVVPFFRKEIKKESHKFDFSKNSGKDSVKDKGKLVKCPVCGHHLKPSDKLFTRTYRAQPRDRVFILGCSECMKENKN